MTRSTALALVGLALSGAQIIAGIKELKQFHDLCCKEAKTPADLKDAGKVFADAVGKIGVNTVLAVLGVKGLKGARGAAAGEDALSAEKIAEIKAMPKGSRPPPETYTAPDSIAAHNALFDNGASRIMPKSNFERFGPSQVDGTSFVLPKADTDALLTSSGGDASVIENRLGLPSGYLSKEPMVLVDFTDPKSLDLSFPSGNEAGASSLWEPGGYLPSGIPEAVVKPTPGSFSVHDLKF